jgi:hypothetical protein
MTVLDLPRFKPWTLDGLSPREMQRIMAGVRGGMLGYNALLNDPPPGAMTFNTFTGPLDVTSNTVNAPFVMPANTLDRPGQMIHTYAAGTFSTTGTPTLVMGTYLGTTVLAVNVALTTASGAVTLPWCLETWTKVAGTGTAGLLNTRGNLVYGTTLTAITNIPVPGIALANVTADTTAAAAWTVKATWSTSSASNIVVTHQYFVESYN